MAVAPAPQPILTVSALTRLIKQSLRDAFSSVWVKGEISSWKRAGSGHAYLTLKDPTGPVLDCVIWSDTRLDFEPRDGMEVEAFGDITVYEARGKYQLVIKEIRPAGLGALLLALEELKRRLQGEGLFDPGRKRALPRFPRTVGLVTSPSGAAVRDIVKVLRARWPSIRIVLAPVRVQGAGAAEEIAAAIARFDRWGQADVLIVGRGGGSLEDLWAFNEEVVVRAVALSKAPVISAIGHEVDTTLTDYAADVRAATPSNAAELAVRDRDEIARRVVLLDGRADRAVRGSLADWRGRLESLTDKYGFRNVRDVVRIHQQRIDDLMERMRLGVRRYLRAARDLVLAMAGRYGLREWPRVLGERRERVESALGRLTPALVDGVHARRTQLHALDDRLRALSPRLVLQRGFCIARAPDGRLVRAADALAIGDRVALEFARGEADARIEAVRPGGTHGTTEESAGR
jgi:exodeoxyribonuclease VII large subunit